MDLTNLRDYAIDYLLNCGFVEAYVKKCILPSDIDNFYEDYLSETFLAILELKDEVWDKLYMSSIEKNTDYQYEIRNYVSIVIRNTVKSTSSNAYRKLKRHYVREHTKNDVQWGVYEYSIPDPTEITDTIQTMND